MHVDILRLLLIEHRTATMNSISNKLLSEACRYSNHADVVQELLDQGADWTVDDFNVAALKGKEHVLRVLLSSGQGAFKKLVDTPPLSRVCTRVVLGDMHAKSARVMICCVKKTSHCRVMAKLVDVLGDLVTGSYCAGK
jgi:hypothetical protein